MEDISKTPEIGINKARLGNMITLEEERDCRKVNGDTNSGRWDACVLGYYETIMRYFFP